MTHERGFTLVEALVAFAILAATLVALYEAMGTGLKGLDRSARVDEAVLVAESKLDELKALKAIPQAPLEGVVEHTPYRWSAELVADEAPEAQDLAASPVRLQKIKLIVTWQDGGVSHRIAVERLLILQRQPGG